MTNCWRRFRMFSEKHFFCLIFMRYIAKLVAFHCSMSGFVSLSVFGIKALRPIFVDEAPCNRFSLGDKVAIVLRRPLYLTKNACDGRGQPVPAMKRHQIIAANSYTSTTISFETSSVAPTHESLLRARIKAQPKLKTLANIYGNRRRVGILRL